MNTTVNPGSAIGFLPYMPLDPSWIEHSLAFLHEDRRMLNAYIRLLFAAWRGAPAGSIPATTAYLAMATGMTQEFISEHMEILTEGFVKTDNGRLQHIALAKLCGRMSAQYGREIETFALATAMAAQDPDVFGIMNMEATSKRPKGKTIIPKGFGFDSCSDDLRGWCDQNGYCGRENQDWIMNKFIDYATGRGDRQANWMATFRTYAANEITRFHRNPPFIQQQTIAMDEVIQAPRVNTFMNLGRQPLSKGERSIEHNRDIMSREAARMHFR